MSIVYDYVSAEETLILNPNVNSKDKKVPECSKNLRDVFQVKGKFFHDNASINKAFISGVCDKDTTEPNCSKSYSKNNGKTFFNRSNSWTYSFKKYC